MEKNNFIKLQNWYQSNCNGDWEHSFGLSINTLDNPGWQVEINLEDTCLENAEINIAENKSEDDWYTITTEERKFKAFGDYTKLNVILEIFFDRFLSNNIDEEFLYELYTPISENLSKIYRPIHASMISESIFKIKKVNKLIDEKKSIQFIHYEDLEGINFNNLEENCKYKINDLVTCDLQRFNSTIGLVITNKINSTT